MRRNDRLIIIDKRGKRYSADSSVGYAAFHLNALLFDYLFHASFFPFSGVGGVYSFTFPANAFVMSVHVVIEEGGTAALCAYSLQLLFFTDESDPRYKTSSSSFSSPSTSSNIRRRTPSVWFEETLLLFLHLL